MSGDSVNWSVAQGRMPDQDDIFRIIADGKGRLQKSSTLFSSGFIDEILSEADECNNERLGRFRIFDRLMRSQGRINRKMCDASEAVLHKLSFLRVEGRARMNAQAHACLTTARYLNHKARGSKWQRRLNRPQLEFNAAMNQALETMSAWLIRGCEEECQRNLECRAMMEHLEWHVREARHYMSLVFGKWPWLGRLMVDQYQINRCHIISIRIIRDMLSACKSL